MEPKGILQPSSDNSLSVETREGVIGYLRVLTPSFSRWAGATSPREQDAASLGRTGALCNEPPVDRDRHRTGAHVVVQRSRQANNRNCPPPLGDPAAETLVAALSYLERERHDI
jgi:hypothetical protein